MPSTTRTAPVDIASRERLLAAIAGGACIDAAKIALVFAHPDDETIACGGLLARMRDPLLVCVTDGAPRDLNDARRHGFATAEDYAHARRAEYHRALDIAGVGPRRRVLLEVADQQAARSLQKITGRLHELFISAGVQAVVTHAYEGGHPDHDATAFAVHAAADLLRRRGHAIGIVEAPLYHLGADGAFMRAQFCGGGTGADLPPEVEAALTGEQRARKRRMIAAYATQAEVLAPFDSEQERFRRAPRYRFEALPNEGRLLYERYDWGLNGATWLRLARTALEARMERPPTC